MNKVTDKISKKIKKIAKRIDVLIKNACGERVGFTLIIYTPDNASYVSSVTREDNMKQLKHLLKSWEEGKPDVKAHEINEDE